MHSKFRSFLIAGAMVGGLCMATTVWAWVKHVSKNVVTLVQ